MIEKTEAPTPVRLHCGLQSQHSEHLWHGQAGSEVAAYRCFGLSGLVRALDGTRPHDYPEGWYEWIKQPNATTHIAYVQENGGIYLPEDGVYYRDFHDAMEKGRAWRMVRVDRVLNAVSSLV